MPYSLVLASDWLPFVGLVTCCCWYLIGVLLRDGITFWIGFSVRMGDFSPFPLLPLVFRFRLVFTASTMPLLWPPLDVLELFNPFGEYLEFEWSGDSGDIWLPLLLFNVIDGVEVVDSDVDCGDPPSGGVIWFDSFGLYTALESWIRCWRNASLYALEIFGRMVNENDMQLEMLVSCNIQSDAVANDDWCVCRV